MSISCQQKGCNGLMSQNDGCFVQGYNWAKGYKCNSCNGVRYMCDICINSDNAMVRRTLHHRSRLCRHHRLYHDDSVRQRNITEVDVIGLIVKDPMQQKKSTNLYYIIDSEWNELNKNMVFCRPTSPGCKY